MSQVQSQVGAESILIADCGSARTKVVLLDIVSGQYRFVAFAESASTVNDPWDDVSLGVVSAIRQIEQTTGYLLLDDEGQLVTPIAESGRGVDRFLAVSSAVEPLSVVLVGLSRDVSLASARRAARTTYSRIVDELALEQDVDLDKPRTDDAKINALWHALPDVICIVGGTDGGAVDPVLDLVHNVVRVALYLSGERVPTVIYAGNAQLREEIKKEIGEIASLHIVDNVRPSAQVENIGPLAEELEVCFYDQQLKYLPGNTVLSDWGAPVVLPVARASDYTTRYCQQSWQSDKPAMSIDLGSASLTMNVCQSGHPLTAVRNDLGLGYELQRLLELIPLEDILRWVPYDLPVNEARNRLMDKALHPNTVAQTREDLLLELAIAREAVRLALRDLWPGWQGRSDGRQRDLLIPACDPLIAGGGFVAHLPYHGYAALMLLDALQPVGVSGLYLDEYNLMPSLGAVASVQPLALVQTVHNGGLTFLGTAVVPMGHAMRGSRALAVRPIEASAGASLEVRYGALKAIPAGTYKPGTMLEIIPARSLDIGEGSGKSVRVAYREGTVGLILDARGRPLDLAGDPEARHQQLDSWLWEMMSI